MRFYKHILLALLLFFYHATFLEQERLFKGAYRDLLPIPSAQLLKATTGYVHQLTAEIFFVQTAVFLGGIKPETDHLAYAPALAHNLRQITSLYPEFVDPYYYANAFLPYIGVQFAKAANTIIATGIATYPNDFVFRLFQGINFLQYMNDPLAAAKAFEDASKLPKAPPMFGHLASILAAQGGNLQAALITLQVLNKSEENEIVRERYRREIEMFRQAIELQNAVTRYYQATGSYPDQLTALVPTYIRQIPSFENLFELVWDPPQVKLQRPSPKQTSPTPWL